MARKWVKPLVKFFFRVCAFENCCDLGKIFTVDLRPLFELFEPFFQLICGHFLADQICFWEGFGDFVQTFPESPRFCACEKGFEIFNDFREDLGVVVNLFEHSVHRYKRRSQMFKRNETLRSPEQEPRCQRTKVRLFSAARLADRNQRTGALWGGSGGHQDEPGCRV